MPITKSAKKKKRQDEKRRLQSLKVKRTYKAAVKEARERPIEEKLKKAYSALDKAVKKGVIKKNKASRLKSNLSQLVKEE